MREHGAVFAHLNNLVIPARPQGFIVVRDAATFAAL
jgi:hypothetical protein